MIKSADRPEIEFKVTCYVIDSAEWSNVYGFYDVTGNFGLDLREISVSHIGAAFDFSSSFSELFLIAKLMRTGQVPH